MGIKYVEYSHKFHVGLGPPYKDEAGLHFAPHEQVWETVTFKKEHPEVAARAEEAWVAAQAGGEEGIAAFKANPPEGVPAQPANLHRFFAIYFCMTGLHGVHVLMGIFVWLWILRRAMRGEFNPQYFGAIDYAALYWHLVDLIWIYLFPLLYLID
jgi:cytochrome c oxidase subunit 3